MAKRYYNLEKETKAFLKRMEETRGVLPDGVGISRVNDYVVKKKGLGLILSNRDKSSLRVIGSLQQSITVASNASLLVTPSWEMVGWIYPTSTNGVREHIGKANNNAGGYDFSLSTYAGGSVQLNYAGGNTSGKTFTINTWQFYNFGRDGSTNNTFLSRNLDSPATAAQVTQNSSNSAFMIGNWGTANNRPSDSIFDGVGRWSRLLTSDQRSFLYNTARGTSYLEILAYRPDILVGCVSYWQLNEPSGIRYDWHGTNHMSPINNPINSTNGLIEKFY